MSQASKENSDAGAQTPSGSTVNAGDDAKPGTPGTGENVCPECHGTGKLGQASCPKCGGTGKVIEGIGGG
jgi:DnaJ-class molecular chaperone